MGGRCHSSSTQAGKLRHNVPVLTEGSSSRHSSKIWVLDASGSCAITGLGADVLS